MRSVAMLSINLVVFLKRFCFVVVFVIFMLGKELFSPITKFYVLMGTFEQI